MKEKISDYIKRIRLENGLTPSQLGDKIGISGRTVESWQSGRNIPNKHTLIFIENLFGERIDEKT